MRRRLLWLLHMSESLLEENRGTWWSQFRRWLEETIGEWWRICRWLSLLLVVVGREFQRWSIEKCRRGRSLRVIVWCCSWKVFLHYLKNCRSVICRVLTWRLQRLLYVVFAMRMNFRRRSWRRCRWVVHRGSMRIWIVKGGIWRWLTKKKTTRSFLQCQPSGLHLREPKMWA